MDLYSILACPTCKVHVERHAERLVCPQCQGTYPIINEVPVLLPGGAVPATEYQHDLHLRATYDPWIHRVVLQSLPASAIILDLGAGNLTLNLPNVIRMDVTLTPYVDVVGDAHHLPFLPETFDFVFSLAVIEHLRQPFLAAEETYNALRPGGYVYGECNFVFAYHGYPHHYFNASQQGLEQVFGAFDKLRSGVAPYQMPSSAVRMLLQSYLQWMKPAGDGEVQAFRLLLREVLDQPLGTYDGLFTEEGALNVAAGVFFFGRKAPGAASTVLPPVVQATWEREPELQARFPQPFDLGTVPNLLLWATGEGRERFPAIAAGLASLAPFHKQATVDTQAQAQFHALPVVRPDFGNIPDPARAARPAGADADKVTKIAERNDQLENSLAERDRYIKHLSSFSDEKLAYITRLESLIHQRDAQITALQTRLARQPLARLTQRLRRLRSKKAAGREQA